MHVSYYFIKKILKFYVNFMAQMFVTNSTGQ